MNLKAFGLILPLVFLSTNLAEAQNADLSSGLDALKAGDVAAASADFAKAYEAGDGAGAFWLGRLFELGIGTKADPARAANLYSAAAEKGDLQAKLRLGLMYHEGTVLLRDYVEGTKLICAAADGGLADAQVACGLAYEAGRGVAADPTAAHAQWVSAAKTGNVAAINLLGAAALKADDGAAAADWFEKSAEAGNAIGLFERAKLEAAGEKPDLKKAYMYASLAAVRGHPDATAFINEIEATMKPADVLAAQGMAKAWTEDKIKAAAKAAQP